VRLQVVRKADRGGAIVEAQCGEPVAMTGRPGTPGAREVELAPQAELRDPVAAAHQVDAHVLAAAHEIAEALLLGLGDVDDDEIAGCVEAGELERVALVGLDAVAGVAADVAGRADGDVEAARGGRAGEAIAGRACLIDGAERRLELLEPAEHSIGASADLSRLDLAAVEVEDGTG
jgi:hypothetical protein